ncbi:unnamed protein product [Calicophoron daubneyi]|uniref:Cadherin domain-containing protein n=1 Tax=Calicophoron daubneyi TaxID=300641 RepID=A0AAV2TZL5_CALDB
MTDGFGSESGATAYRNKYSYVEHSDQAKGLLVSPVTQMDLFPSGKTTNYLLLLWLNQFVSLVRTKKHTGNCIRPTHLTFAGSDVNSVPAWNKVPTAPHPSQSFIVVLLLRAQFELQASSHPNRSAGFNDQQCQVGMVKGQVRAKSSVRNGLTTTHWVYGLLHSIIFFLSLLNLTCATQIIHFQMDEEKPPGYLVGLLLKHLPDLILTTAGKLAFRPIQQGHSHLFTVGPTDGRIQLADRIDRETLCPYSEQAQNPNSREGSDCQLSFTVNLLLIKPSITEIGDVLRIQVQVNDIDDNKCFFTPDNRQTVTVPENTPPNNLLPIPLNQPCDIDTGEGNGLDIDRIMLVAGDGTSQSSDTNLFSLRINKTGSLTKPFSIYLIVNNQLDYETKSRYSLIVEAGGGTNANCQLQLNVEVTDLNDHSPRFTQNYSSIQIPETASLNVPIYTVSAFDSDSGNLYSQLIYELDPFVSSHVKSTFRIDRNNGSVFLRRPLNYRKQSVYDIPLIVRNPQPDSAQSGLSADNRFFDRAQLHVSVIDVNDKSPSISVYAPEGEEFISIPEHSTDFPLDFAVVSVTDEDTGPSGLINCTLEPEAMDRFKLTLISNSNEEDSLRRGYKRSAFHMVSRNAHSPVEVIYKLSALKSFDREVTPQLSLKIICEDSGNPRLSAEHTVRIQVEDKNDHAPHFNQTKWKLNVNEDSDPRRARVHYFIEQIVADDEDEGVNAQITYSLQENTPVPYFKVNKSTGTISSLGTLDREQTDHHHFILIATDGGQPPLTGSTTVDIFVRDYNDEVPVFDKPVYEFHVSENRDFGEFVGSLQATDKDLGPNSILHFRLEYMASAYGHGTKSVTRNLAEKLPFDIASYFDTSRNTYEIRIYTNRVIDREANRRENTANRDIMLLDEQMFGGDTINSGANGQTFRGYKFWVIGEDEGVPRQRGQALFTVRVDDVNDEAPEFQNPRGNSSTVSLSYLEKPGHKIIQIFAIDADEGVNGTVRYELESVRAYNYTSPAPNADDHESLTVKRTNTRDLFTIHPIDGMLRLNKALTKLDLNSVYQLVVVARDLGIPQSLRTATSLFIHVDDTDPVGDEAADYSLITPDDVYGYKPDEGSSVNLYIIIAIVAISFLISAILISGICIALRRRKINTNKQSDATPREDNRRSSMSGCQYQPTYKANRIHTKEIIDSTDEVSDEIASLSKCMKNGNQKDEIALKSLIYSQDVQSPVSKPLIAYSPPVMQVVGMESLTSTLSSSELQAMGFVSTNVDKTNPTVLNSPSSETDSYPLPTGAIILCSPETAQHVDTSAYTSPNQLLSKMITEPQQIYGQPVTVLSCAHTMEIQHLCLHQKQKKRSSLGSIDQDSGNGDSLDNNTQPTLPVSKSIWVPTPIALSTETSGQPFTLPLVHVYTPLSCVTEAENSAASSSVNN